MSKPRICHELFDDVWSKWCPRCEQWKGLREYQKDKKTWDGLRGRCRACDKALPFQSKSLEKRLYKAEVLKQEVTKVCRVCKVLKDKDKFRKNLRYTDSLMQRCTECIKNEKKTNKRKEKIKAYAILTDLKTFFTCGLF